MITTIRLGVTGLRQSGKTVFLTALAYHLVERGFGGDEPRDIFHTKGIRIFPGREIPSANAFPFHDHIRKLRQEVPVWPPATTAESELVIDFKYQGQQVGFIEKTRHWLTRGAKVYGKVRLYLHDYPGEYLLDLPMLRSTFDNWSRAVLKGVAEQIPNEHDGYVCEMRKLMEESAANSSPEVSAGNSSQETLCHARRLYVQLIATLRTQGFEMIQPGMILAGWDGRNCPEIQEQLSFVPLPDFEQTSRLHSDMQAAYDAYCKERVRPFATRLGRSDRQLVLVDLFRILRSGKIACYNDARACLREIIGGYVYSDNFLARRFRRLLPTRLGVAKGVRRVTLAATKADHATKNNRPNLKGLLRELTDVLHAEWQGAVPQPECHYFSSRLCVRDDEEDGQFGNYSVLVGRPIALPTDTPDMKVYPGEVPAAWPDEDWEAEDSFPEFRPYRIPAKSGAVWPNLGLADVLWSVLNDRLPIPVSGNR